MELLLLPNLSFQNVERESFRKIEWNVKRKGTIIENLEVKFAQPKKKRKSNDCQLEKENKV